MFSSSRTGRLRRTRIVAALILSIPPAATGLAAPAATAAPARPGASWSSPVTALDPGCEPDFSSAAATADAAGRIHGFASFVRGTCTGDPLWYAEGRSGRWTQELSPYHGEVLATAADATGSWLLYLDAGGYDRVMLTRRSPTGRWSPPRTLSRLEGSAVGSGVQGAALVAADGRWWAVWAQALPDPESSSPATRLFQAKTLGGTRSARPIGAVPATMQETGPALALVTDRRGRPAGAVLTWARDVEGAVTHTQNDQLRYARAGLDGRWSARVSVPAGPTPAALHPALFRSAGTTWLAWQRQSLDLDGPATSDILISRHPAAPGAAPVFTAAGGAPVIGAGAGRVAVAWPTADRGGIVVATRAGAGWATHTVRFGNDATSLRPLALAGTTLLVQSRSAAGRWYAVSTG